MAFCHQAQRLKEKPETLNGTRVKSEKADLKVSEQVLDFA
jgi:hypothetical protein